MNANLTLEDLSIDHRLLEAEYEEIKNAHAVVVRHGRSQANAGQKTAGVGSALLTDEGHQQAEHLANFLPEKPTAIIHSPFVRTRLTAAPSIARFPDVEVLEWPIQEFTFLNPDKYVGTTSAERKEYVDNYWRYLKPDQRDGGIAESFADFWIRVETFRKNLKKLAPGALVFSHGQFMRMMQLQEMFDRPSKEAMAAFHDLETLFKIANTTRIAVFSSGVMGKTKVSHLPKELITF